MTVAGVAPAFQVAGTGIPLTCPVELPPPAARYLEETIVRAKVVAMTTVVDHVPERLTA